MDSGNYLCLLIFQHLTLVWGFPWNVRGLHTRRIFLSFPYAAALFISFTVNVAKSSIPIDRDRRQPEVWWYSEKKDAVRKKCKAFTSAHLSDKKYQAYILASGNALSVIAKAMTWDVSRFKYNRIFGSISILNFF